MSTDVPPAAPTHTASDPATDTAASSSPPAVPGRSPRPRAFAVRYRWSVVVASIVFLATAVVVGGGVAEHLTGGGFEVRDAESAAAAELLEQRFGTGTPNLVAVVSTDGRSVDDPEVVAAAEDLVRRLAAESSVAEVSSYWSLGGAAPLRSTDGTEALVLARLPGSDNEVQEAARGLIETYDGAFGGLQVDLGGQGVVFAEVEEIVEGDLLTAEMFALPITLALLVLIFGSVVAGLLPLAIGGFAILGTFLVLRITTVFVDVSIFALNFTTAIGLGLAIDYSLLVVSRYREELAEGHEVPEAIRRTLRTAGRTVVVSAATVASSLTALLVFEMSFLRSFAYAGVAVVALAAVGAVVLLPAILALVGRNVDRLRVRRVRASTHTTGAWHRIAHNVMRRPIPVATTVTALLVFVGLPFLGVQLGFPDDRVLPTSAESRVVGDTIRDRFPAAEAGAISVVADGIGLPAATPAVEDLAVELSRLDGVARVDAVTGSYLGGRQIAPATPLAARFVAPDATYVSVVPSVEPMGPEAGDLVAEIRATQAPFPVLVGGISAEYVDSRASLVDRLPLALAVIATITFIVLFLQFGSVLVPLKAIVLNLLSLSAAFGALVWVFQDGNLSGVLGFTPTGALVMAMPVLMFCIAFGLSMDYEVFLLSRIKEEYDRTGDNTASVAIGLERTGRIVTAAAVLMAVIFVSFGVTAQVSMMIMFGLGMALAVLTDAFLVRATLVPAFMRLAGHANWWAPAPLRRLHDRFGIREHLDADDVVDRPEEVVVPSTP